MLKKLGCSCVVLVAAAAFSMPAQARAVRASGVHVGHINGARVAVVNRGIYRNGYWRGRYANGYPGWRAAAGVAAGVAAASALTYPYYSGYAYDSGYGGYAYDQGYGYYGNGGVTYQGGPRYPYYQQPYYSPYKQWWQF